MNFPHPFVSDLLHRTSPSPPTSPKSPATTVTVNPVISKGNEIIKAALPAAINLGVILVTKRAMPRMMRMRTQWRSNPLVQVMRGEFKTPLSKEGDLFAGTWFSSLAEGVKLDSLSLQTLRQLKKETVRAQRISAKKFQRKAMLGGMILGTLAQGCASYLIEKDKEKRDSAKEKFNVHIGTMRQQGQELSELKAAREVKSEERKNAILKNMQSMITQLPEEDQEQLTAHLGEMIQAIDQAHDLASEEIFQSLVQYGQLKPESVSDRKSLKDISAQMVGPFVGLALTLACGQLPIARTMIQKLVESGLSQQIVERILAGSIISITQEMARAAISQNVTLGEVKGFSTNILKALNIDPTTHSEPAQPEEKKLNESLANIMISTFAKCLAAMAHEDAVGDMVELASNSILQTSMSENIEGALDSEQADQLIEESLTPVYDKTAKLKGRIEAIGSEADFSELIDFQTAIRDKLKAIEQQRAEGPLAQASGIGADQQGWFSKVSWLNHWY